MSLFANRSEAGKALANALGFLKGKETIVLAIPRGGVLVAKEVADALEAPLDVVVTRKVGAPGNPEYAIGAVDQDGEFVTDESAVKRLDVSPDFLRKEATEQRQEVSERMRRYRGERPIPTLEGKTVVIVDDGIATGLTVHAAVLFVKRMKPSSVIIAVPVAPRETVARLSIEVDRVVCLESPEPFFSVGQFYGEFDQVSDGEVRRALDEARSASQSRAPA